VIDPTLLYSTFLGGSAGYGCGPFSCSTAESAQAIAVDAAGNAYVTGFTQSLDFPTTVGAYQVTSAGSSAFVSKLNPLGNHLVYSTYLGGASGTTGHGIAVDAAQEVYVTGNTGSGFPTTANAYQQACSSSGTFFLTKVSSAGNSLLYSTCFGLSYFSNAFAIALDMSGRAYIVGNDTTGALPTTSSAYQAAYAGASGYGGDGFLTVFDPSQSGTSSLAYSTYLGGSNDDVAYGVAVDSFGMAYVAGYTASLNFPVTPGAFKTTYPNVSSTGGASSAFVAKLNPSATGSASLVYSTYLGGSGRTVINGGAAGADVANSIAVDSLGQAHVTGGASSVDFPVTSGAFQTSAKWVHNAFVTTLNASGNGLVQSTFLGGSSGDQNYAAGIALDALGNAYVTGTTGAPDFPHTPNAVQPSLAGGSDAFVTVLNTTGTALLYSSFLGGGNLDQGYGIAVDAVGDAYVTGYTESVDFPVTAFAVQFTLNPGGASGPADAFVTKAALAGGQALSLSSILPSSGGNSGSVSPQIFGSGFHLGATLSLSCGSGSIPGTNVSVQPNGRILSATFNLNGVAPGACNVVVGNPDGTSATLSGSFSIVQGGAPQVWIDLLGYIGLRVGQQQTYLLAYGNRGTVDSPTVRLWVSFDSFLAWSPPPNQPPVSQGQLNGKNYIAFDVSPSAGASGVIPISLSATGNPAPHQPFTIQAWLEGR